MEAKSYNRNNFHKNTFCIFTEAAFSEIENQKPDYKSKSGSAYYFTENGVYRLSDHWGRAANCKWRLQTDTRSESRIKLGFAQWTAFHRDNDSEKLYFIEVDFEGNSVNFQHKESGNIQPGSILRTASETTKRIRQIRTLQKEDAWTRHYPQDPETVKRKVILELIQTDKTLQQIKSQLL